MNIKTSDFFNVNPLWVLQLLYLGIPGINATILSKFTGDKISKYTRYQLLIILLSQNASYTDLFKLQIHIIWHHNFQYI